MKLTPEQTQILVDQIEAIRKDMEEMVKSMKDFAAYMRESADRIERIGHGTTTSGQ